MTTIRQIVTDAYREGGTLQIGTEIDDDELNEGIRKLQSIITQLYGHEAGEPFTSVNYGTGSVTNSYATEYDKKDALDAYFIPANIRLLVNSTQSQTIFLDPAPQAGARLSVVDVAGTFATKPFTIKANGQRIEGGTQVVLNENGANSQWFYRDDKAEWVKVSDLTASSESPFPPEFDELLITSLAMRLNPRLQTQTAPETLQAYRQAKSQFRSRYRQTDFVPSDVSRLFHNGFVSLNSTTAFNKGLIAK